LEVYLHLNYNIKKNKTSIKDNCENPSNINYEINNNINTINKDYQISISLTYFSFIANVSLTIIGVTGLYLALIHLQSLNAILNTLYRNILIIKLSLAILMIFIGRYNQTKIQNYITLVKNIKMNNDNNNLDVDIFIKDNKKRNVFFKDINKSIKIESLIGISVLVAV
jgi:copper transport protein